MKRLVLCLVFFALILNISAQEAAIEEVSVPKQEVYLGLGLLNDNQLVAMIGDALSSIFTLGYLVEPDEYKAFTPFIGYRYNLTKRFSMGGLFAYDVNSVKVAKDLNEDGQLDKNEMMNKQKVKRHYFTFTVEPKLNYVAKPAFQLYGYWGMGVTVIKYANATFTTAGGSETPEVRRRLPYFNMQITPVGMRFGKNAGGFWEFGYGYKGIINAGFSYKF